VAHNNLIKDKGFILGVVSTKFKYRIESGHVFSLEFQDIIIVFLIEISIRTGNLK